MQGPDQMLAFEFSDTHWDAYDHGNKNTYKDGTRNIRGIQASNARATASHNTKGDSDEPPLVSVSI